MSGINSRHNRTFGWLQPGWVFAQVHCEQRRARRPLVNLRLWVLLSVHSLYPKQASLIRRIQQDLIKKYSNALCQYHFLVIDVLDFLYCKQVSSIPKWFEFSGTSSVRHKHNYSFGSMGIFSSLHYALFILRKMRPQESEALDMTAVSLYITDKIADSNTQFFMFLPSQPAMSADIRQSITTCR